MEASKKRKDIPVMAFLLGVIAVILAFAAFKALGSVLKPIVFAWVLSAMLAPLVSVLSNKLRLPQVLSIFIAMALTVFIVFEAGVLINSLVSSFVGMYGEYMGKMQELLKHFYEMLPDKAVAMLKSFEWQPKLTRSVLSLSGTLISASTTTVIVMIIASFMLIERRDFDIKVAEAFENSARVSGVIRSITTQVSRYLLLQLVISAVTGLCVWLALWSIGIDFAATWGVLAFVLNFIPTIGSIVASIPPLLIALVQHAPESYWPFILALVAILFIQMTIGNVVAPRVMGEHLNLSPVAVLVSLLFWGWLWGPAGALLSTPITAAIKIICDNIGPLEPIGILLGSARPFRKAR